MSQLKSSYFILVSAVHRKACHILVDIQPKKVSQGNVSKCKKLLSVFIKVNKEICGFFYLDLFNITESFYKTPFIGICGICLFRHNESVITSSWSLKIRGAAAPRIYSNSLAASLGFDILFLILTIEDA